MHVAHHVIHCGAVGSRIDLHLRFGGMYAQFEYSYPHTLFVNMTLRQRSVKVTFYADVGID